MDLIVLPFAESPELPCDIPEPVNDVPYTVVNTRPLDGTPFIAPFVACPVSVIPAALEMAQISTSDILMDLGCGDGRILEWALEEKRPRRVIGVELDPYLAQHARDKLLQYGSGLILEKDMFTVSPLEYEATVMILYLLPRGLDLLRTQLETWLKVKSQPAKRIVTIEYPIPWAENPVSIRKVQYPKRTLYLYDVTSIPLQQ